MARGLGHLPVVLAGILAAGGTGSRSARADEPPADDARSEADKEFNEGKQLMDAGQLGPACARFARSQELDPKLGRLLNLAFCHEQEGKTASAWSEYNAAAALAEKRTQDERAEFAREHAAAVARRLSFVHFAVPPTAITVDVDGTGVGRDKWATPLAFDPGEHTVTSHAPGKRDGVTAFVVNDAPGVQDVDVAPPEDPPIVPAAPAPMTVPVRRETLGPRDATAWIAGGIGATGLAVGATFGLVAMVKRNSADSDCPAKRCDAAGSSLISEAKWAATVSDVGFGVAVAGAAVATWLFLRPGNHHAVAQWIPVIGPASSGMALEGSW